MLRHPNLMGLHQCIVYLDVELSRASLKHPPIRYADRDQDARHHRITQLIHLSEAIRRLVQKELKHVIDRVMTFGHRIIL